MKTENTASPEKSSKSEPFMKVKVECPLCEKENKHIVLKDHLFKERNLDVDLRPKEIIWLAKDINIIVPRLYYIWFCAGCSYAAGQPYYKNPVEKFPLTLNKFRDRYMSTCLNIPEATKIVTILKEGIDLDTMDYFQSIKLHLLAIFENMCIPEIAKKDAMNLGRYCLRLAWLYRDVSEDNELKASLEKRLPKLFSALKKNWAKVPENEEQALKLAIRYYKVTHEKSYVVKSGQDELSLMLLMTRFYITLGKIGEAKKMIEKCKDKAVKTDSERKKIARASGGDREAKLAAEGRTTDLSIKEVQDIIDGILQEREAKQIEIARLVIEKFPNKKPAEVRKYLLEKKFSETVVDKLLPKKKGLLGLFK